MITEDAKQRNVHLAPEYQCDSAAKRPYIANWRICAEASPDVFSALSASASAELGIARRSGDVGGRAQAVLALAESAATIERTQTVTLLRESMYRTCERYMSNAIGKDAFVVQAGRDWRAMIAILAIEQLTRMSRPPSTILISPGTGAAITGSIGLVAELSRAAREAQSAKIVKEKADKEYTDKQCATVPAQVAGEAADITQKRQACAGLRQGQIAAVEELRKAEATRNSLSDAVAKAPGAASGSQAVSSTSGAGGGLAEGVEAARTASGLAAVAGVVQQITSQALNTDETQLFCIQVLSDKSYADDVAADCRSYLSSKIRFESNWYQQSISAGPPPIPAETAGLANKLTAYLAIGDDRVAKWRALVQAVGAFPPAVLAKLNMAGSYIASIRSVFEVLALDAQRMVTAKIP